MVDHGMSMVLLQNKTVSIEYYFSLRLKCTLGDRAFSASAPKTWNALPANIRSQTDFNTYVTADLIAVYRPGFFYMIRQHDSMVMIRPKGYQAHR